MSEQLPPENDPAWDRLLHDVLHHADTSPSWWATLADDPAMSVRDYEGTYGNRDHITRAATGLAPVSALIDLVGARGEAPGEHRNRQGEKWETFVADVRDRGVQTAIFITVDPGQAPQISEGNHRRDAAVEAGLTHVPVEIRFYGHAESDPR